MEDENLNENFIVYPDQFGADLKQWSAAQFRLFGHLPEGDYIPFKNDIFFEKAYTNENFDVFSNPHLALSTLQRVIQCRDEEIKKKTEEIKENYRFKIELLELRLKKCESKKFLEKYDLYVKDIMERREYKNQLKQDS